MVWDVSRVYVEAGKEAWLLAVWLQLVVVKSKSVQNEGKESSASVVIL